jgi:hypothetical protein
MAWLCKGLIDSRTAQVSCKCSTNINLGLALIKSIASIFDFIPGRLPANILFAATVQPRLETVDDTQKYMASMLAI